MEKKLLAILFIIVLIIVYVGPVLLACIIFMLLWMGCFTLYRKHPNGVSRLLSYIITPLLVLGWGYIVYVIYSHNICNTYRISYHYYEYYNNRDVDYKIIARTEIDAYIKVWKDFISANKNDIMSGDGLSPYLNALTIWNESKNKQCHPSRYENIDSIIKSEKLYYKNKNLKFDFLDLTRGW